MFFAESVWNSSGTISIHGFALLSEDGICLFADRSFHECSGLCNFKYSFVYTCFQTVGPAEYGSFTVVRIRRKLASGTGVSSYRSLAINLKIIRVMMNVRKGELYVFCSESAGTEPIYAVFEEYESGCLYVNFMLSTDRFETEGCLPDGYVCARPATEDEKTDFERRLEIYRHRLSRIERCLSERGIGDMEEELSRLLIV